MRASQDEHDIRGSLINGFEYDLQVWVKDGRIVRCGHPSEMNCGCNGKTFEGLTVEDAKDVVAQAKHMGIATIKQ
jgi:hypothetical protein